MGGRLQEERRYVQHAKDGMIEARSGSICHYDGFFKRAKYHVAITVRVEFCTQHAKDNAVHVNRKACMSREGCDYIPFYRQQYTREEGVERSMP